MFREQAHHATAHGAEADQANLDWFHAFFPCITCRIPRIA